jgi:hypothetical protein
VPRIHFRVETKLRPEAVLAALTDFTDHRAEVWPNIDREHYRLHESGPHWAIVTEGSSVAGGVWERNRYDWDEAGHGLAVKTLDSNTWADGSRWDYRMTPSPAGGTLIDVDVTRIGRGLKGRMLGAALGLVGRRRLRSDLERVLDGLAARPT